MTKTKTRAKVKLTPGQEKFCANVVKYGNASKAYRKTYRAPKASAKSINERASRLMANSKISARIRELRAPIVEDAQLTLASHLESLAGIRDMAIDEKQLSAAVAAEVARGKASGLYVERFRGEVTLPELIVRRREA